MGSGYPTLGVGYMGPAGRREGAGEQSKIFHIFERERDKAIELDTAFKKALGFL